MNFNPQQAATEFANHLRLIPLYNVNLTVIESGNQAFAYVRYNVNGCHDSMIKFFPSIDRIDCAQISVCDQDDFQHQLIKHINFIKSLDKIDKRTNVNFAPFQGY